MAFPWLERMIAAGVIPPNARRVIIDIKAGEYVKVYYEGFADEAMFDDDLMAVVRDSKPIGVAGV